MKKTFTLLLLFFCLISIGQSDQSPELKFQGSNVSLQKGVIDQELLTALIQKKQEEVKKDVFFNLVVGNFKKLSNSNSPLHNFTTYYYIYNVFDEISSGKSKKAMTQALLKNRSITVISTHMLGIVMQRIKRKELLTLSF